jgi:hypothetical protein
LIEIEGQDLYLQYNVQASYNDGNTMVGFANRVTIVEAQGDKTDLKAGLDVDDGYTNGNVEIRICYKDADVAVGAMIVGIGTHLRDHFPFVGHVGALYFALFAHSSRQSRDKAEMGWLTHVRIIVNWHPQSQRVRF